MKLWWVILILSEARCSGCCTLQMTNSLLHIDSSLQCFQCICMYVWLDALYLSTRNYQLSLIATFPSRPNWAMNIGIARKMLLNFALISPFIHFRTSPPRFTNIRLLMHVHSNIIWPNCMLICLLTHIDRIPFERDVKWWLNALIWLLEEKQERCSRPRNLRIRKFTTVKALWKINCQSHKLPAIVNIRFSSIFLSKHPPLSCLFLTVSWFHTKGTDFGLEN